MSEQDYQNELVRYNQNKAFVDLRLQCIEFAMRSNPTKIAMIGTSEEKEFDLIGTAEKIYQYVTCGKTFNPK